jgi:hypothetical protein
MVIFARVSTTQRTIADAVPFDDYHVHGRYWDGMDAEQTIAEIEYLERIFEAPDTIAHRFSFYLSIVDCLAFRLPQDSTGRLKRNN